MRDHAHVPRWFRAVCCLAASTIIVAGAHAEPTVLQSGPAGRFIDVSTDPPIRFWWDPVPDDIKRQGLDTGQFSNIRPSDYAGPKACVKCHKAKYSNWSKHPHRWMNAPAKEQTVRGDFSDGAHIDYYGGRATFYKEADEYRMQLSRDALKRTYEITQTLGSRFFQYYVGRQIEGPEPKSHVIYKSEHVLPFGYWIDYSQWVPVVHVEAAREGEPSQVDSMRRDPYANPGVVDYGHVCSRCHTTVPMGDWLMRAATNFPPSPRGFAFSMSSYIADAHPQLLDPETDPRDVSFQAIHKIGQHILNTKPPVWEVTSGIACEACHNGLKAHVEDENVLPVFFPANPNIFIEGQDIDKTLGRTATNQNWICARCHIGDRFEYAGGMSSWNSVEYVDATEGACYKSTATTPQLTCVHCHDPHIPTGRKWSRTPAEDDASCLKCHKQLEPTALLAAHTHHPIDTSGSRCMNCHMPRINEGLQDMVRTHTIFSPTNAQMIEGNQPNACNMCHVDKSIDWTLRYLEQWYGATYDQDDLAANYQEEARSGPATLGWLHNWHAPTQMVAVDVLTKAKATWALPDLVQMLDSKYLLHRQFTLIGIERMLDIDLDDFDYRFYMFENERREPLERIRATLLKDTGEYKSYGADRLASSQDDEEESIRHYRHLLKSNPDSFGAHYNLGVALQARGELDEAIAHYRRTIQLRPGFVNAYNNLGHALLSQGKAEQAIDVFRQILRINPRFAKAHYNLGNVFHALDNFDDAIRYYREALQVEPTFAPAHYGLAQALMATGRLDDAIVHLREAVRLESDHAEGQYRLAEALTLAGRIDEATPHFREAVRLKPNWLEALNGLAWALATHPAPESRQPTEAIRLAERASDLTSRKNAAVLDTLAAAYAAAEQFGRAVSVARKALELASAGGANGLAHDIQQRLDLYERAKPYRAVEPK